MTETTRNTALRLTMIGGPTVLIEYQGLRLLTDPTFDPAGGEYAVGPVVLRKTAGPAMPPYALGPIDAVLLSHDQHADNLDAAGRDCSPVRVGSSPLPREPGGWAARRSVSPRGRR